MPGRPPAASYARTRNSSCRQASLLLLLHACNPATLPPHLASTSHSLVPPDQADVTSALAAAGDANTLTYEGLFRSGQPDPQGEAQGYVMLASYLAVWVGQGAAGLQCVEEG